MRKVIVILFLIGTSLIVSGGAAFAFPLTMTTLGPQLLAVTDGDLFNQDFQITNGTDAVWTDFHFEIAGLGDYPGGVGGFPAPTAQGIYGFIDAAGGGHDGTAYDGPGSYSVDAPAAGKLLDVVGISISPGSMFDFAIDTDDFESFGDYWVVGFASTDGDTGSVPEPSTLFLLGAGIIGMLGSTRKVKTIKRS